MNNGSPTKRISANTPKNLATRQVTTSSDWLYDSADDYVAFPLEKRIMAVCRPSHRLSFRLSVTLVSKGRPYKFGKK